MSSIDWRIGVEIELLAPSGKSRFDLANAISSHYQGRVQRYFHPQSEPSLVPGTPIFHNLTLGFEVLDARQHRVAQCVDDLTLQADLNRHAPPKAGWYRVVSDDERLLRLIKQQADATLPLEQVMNPIAKLFGMTPELGAGGMIRVNDESGASIAIAAPLPGERERPCELITPPMENDHKQKLELLLNLARQLQFTAPVEGATHIHFDATALQSAHAMANLINLYSTYSEILKVVMNTNPHCRRLGTWPESLLELVNSPGFRNLSWEEAREQLKTLKLTKYCDLNIGNCIYAIVDKNTIELRILPVWLDSEPILAVAELFIALFKVALAPAVIGFSPVQKYSAEAFGDFLQILSLSERQSARWKKTLNALNNRTLDQNHATL